MDSRGHRWHALLLERFQEQLLTAQKRSASPDVRLRGEVCRVSVSQRATRIIRLRWNVSFGFFPQPGQAASSPPSFPTGFWQATRCDLQKVTYRPAGHMSHGLSSVCHSEETKSLHGTTYHLHRRWGFQDSVPLMWTPRWRGFNKKKLRLWPQAQGDGLGARAAFAGRPGAGCCHATWFENLWRYKWPNTDCRTYMCVYTCIYRHMHMRVHIYIYICICIYTWYPPPRTLHPFPMHSLSFPLWIHIYICIFRYKYIHIYR